MGQPTKEDNYKGYEDASLVDRTRWLRGKEFFLAHGMADRNVHVQHSMILAARLARDNIPFEQQVQK